MNATLRSADFPTSLVYPQTMKHRFRAVGRHSHAFRRSSWSSGQSLTVIIAGVLVTTLLTGCGPQNGNQRPADEVLQKGIAQLIQSFESAYPKLKNWDDAAVSKQISKKLPIGNSAEAGWHLQWPAATDGELSQVYVPWG